MTNGALIDINQRYITILNERIDVIDYGLMPTDMIQLLSFRFSMDVYYGSIYEAQPFWF